MPRVATSIQVGATFLDSMDGGLNLRDAPTQIQPNETPDCMNVTLDERGGVNSRLGLLKLNPGSLLFVTPVALYYSAVAGALVAYTSTDGGVGRLYKSTDGGVTWSSFYTALTQGGAGAFIDFKNRLVFVNTLDGVYSFPSDLSAPTHTVGGTGNMEEVRGSAIAMWQNKLWVTGDIREDATHSKARVWFSNASSEVLWTVATAFVDIRDVDTLPCTNIGAGMGMDVTGKPTLLVYKQESVYRINDSTSGSYTTLHSRGAGSASNRTVVSVLGRICSINQNGIWVTDGVSIPQRVSDKISPLFSPLGLNLSQLANWTAGPWRDRAVFSVTSSAASKNDLVLEYHPAVGWIVPHIFRRTVGTMPIGPMALYTKTTSSKLVAFCELFSGNGMLVEMFKGGSDDGLFINARFQSPWFVLDKGDEGRLRSLRVYGRGSCEAQLRQDFATIGDAYTLTFQQGLGFTWDVGNWDVGLWGDPATEGNANQPLDQVCKHVSFRFSNSTDTSSFQPPLLGTLATPEVGAWGIYEAKLDYIQLGT